MDVLGVLKVVASGYGWLKSRINSAHRLSSRLLDALDAHAVPRARVNSLLPEALRLPLAAWSDADHLKPVLQQGHVDWLIDRFHLKREWLEGEHPSANAHIFCYKQPQLLHEWLASRSGSAELTDVRLHVVVGTNCDSRQPHGPFALVLEVMANDDFDCASRFYHLGEGSHFEHYPCQVHLVQVQAIAHYHGAIMSRSTLRRRALTRLSLNIGIIPYWLAQRRSHIHAADYELWVHFSGQTPELSALRQDAMNGLRAAGLGLVVDKIATDQARYLA